MGVLIGQERKRGAGLKSGEFGLSDSAEEEIPVPGRL